MFVRKRYMVQKSFRIDQEVESDLEKLAKLTGKSQNDLVNIAVVEMLQDNKMNFLSIAPLEHFENQFDLGKCLPSDEFEDFELGGLHIELKILEDEKIKISMMIHKGQEIYDKEEKVFDDFGYDAERYVEGLNIYIDREADDVAEYLEKRTDYRDYVKIRN